MDKPPPILVIGGSGQLGRELAARASELGNFVQLDRRELDLTDGNAIARRLDDARAQVRAELQSKRTLLKTALSTENYEEAAILRDEIRVLESGLSTAEAGAN